MLYTFPPSGGWIGCIDLFAFIVFRLYCVGLFGFDDTQLFISTENSRYRHVDVFGS